MDRDTALRQFAPLLAIAAGGVLGTYTRYATELLVGGELAPTLLGNVAGCFLLGLVLFDRRADEVLSRRHRLVFGTGFCASFTTYSTFVLDVVQSTPALALAYVAASYGLGFAAVLASRIVVGAIGSASVSPPPARGDRS